MAKEKEKEVNSLEELTMEEYQELMSHRGADGKLNSLMDVAGAHWPKGWRLVDPNLGRRFMVKVLNITPEEYEKVREDVENRLEQKEGEDDEGFLLRKMLYARRYKSMWKQGESGNPEGLAVGTKLNRAKNLPVTVRSALDEQLSQQVRVMIEEEGKTARQIKLTKKELIARNIVDMVALGRVEFPDAKHPTTIRVLELSARDWGTNALKLLKMINPRPMEETEEIVQTINFDIESMMPTSAKMKVVKRITGRDYTNELEYLDDPEAVDGIIDYVPEDDEMYDYTDMPEVYEDEE